ncbi:efflux RND transporter permease subunit [Leptospira andrefontaineae]|uniref:Efflux RND transporter permease subunit n=1 Tax=Leptospira andrefontaineae TaxID=2484976 RepID=A0A4R9HAX0_9LEPT|nr:efflux RND transporter permease subunit [Leptospira andrefontaineae]TGK43532.1 efflux RND transporter permease subunit [Leptospira andrefontaineae]
MIGFIRFCTERPVSVLMGWTAVILFGIIALGKIKITLLPEISFPRVTVITDYPNASPQEVENMITKPLTDSIGTVGGIEKITSESLEGLSIITVQFSFNVSVDYAIIELREKIDLIRDALPQEAGKPIATRFDPSASSFQEIAIFPKSEEDSKSIRTFVRDNVKVYLERIEGMAYVQISGGFEKEVKVEIDSEKMNAYGISIPDIKRYVTSSNINSPAGSLQVGNKDLLLRTIGEYSSLQDIRDTIVGSNQQGVPIDLASFSEIKTLYKERTGISRYNGKDCVILYLYKESGKNAVELSERVSQELVSVNERFKDKLKAKVVYDEAVFIKDSVSGLVSSLIVGALLAFLILVFIIRNLKTPFILLSIIPTSLLATFLCFYVTGISLNMMSLGGLALGIGMLFDTSNVIFSSIERNLEKGKGVSDAAVQGANEVIGSVVSATLTTVIVFLPIIFIKSFIGILFSEMAVAIVISILVSFIASISIIPTLYVTLQNFSIESPWLEKNVFLKSESIYEQILGNYEKRISEYLDNPKKLIFYLGLGLLLSLQFICVLPKEFMPNVDNGEFTIHIETPQGTSLQKTTDITESMERTLSENSSIEHLISKIGYEKDDFIAKKKGGAGSNKATIRVILKDNSRASTKGLIEKYRNKFNSLSGVKIIYENGGDIVANILSPEAGRLNLEIHGEDLLTLRNIGSSIIQKIQSAKAAVDIRSSMEETRKEYAIEFDPVKATSLNLTNEYLAGYVRTANFGSNITRVKLDGEELDVRISFRKKDIDSVEKFFYMNVKTPTGELVRLSQIGEIKEIDSQSSVLRSGNSRINAIYGELKEDSDISTIESIVSSIKLPPGYSIRFGGEKENIEKSYKDLLFAFLMAALLIYMLLASQFQSLKVSLVMICTIPLMFIGIFPGLFLFGKSFNISAFLGLVLLLGVVVDNASLYYEYLILMKKEGLSNKKAALESGKIVLRPILMNNLTSMLGLLPVVFELQRGAEFQSPMAIVVIIGLLSSFVFSLFLLPVFFYRLHSINIIPIVLHPEKAKKK